MSADEVSTQDDPHEVAYDKGWGDGVDRKEPSPRVGTDGEVAAYWDGYRMGLRETPSFAGRHRNDDRDHWWYRPVAWLAARWGK
jgi:hypothetical protein